jgi:hypothetical protein
MAGEGVVEERKMKPQIEVHDSLFDPREYDPPSTSVLYQKTPDGAIWYRVFLFILGPEAPLIEKVQYVLPPGLDLPTLWIEPSFENQFCVVQINVPKTNFEVFANVWRKFDEGSAYILTHRMRWGEDLTTVTESQFEPSESLVR